MIKYIIILLISTFPIVSFSQLTFSYEEYISEVLAKDFGILMMKNEQQIAANENNIGAAGYLPRISMDARQDFTVNSARQEFLGGQTNEADNAQNRAFDVGGLLEWTFFDGFKMFATDKKLNHLEETAQLNTRAEIEFKIYEASIQFYTYLLLKEMQSTYETAVDLSKLRFEDMQNKFENGVATKVELLQSELDLTADSSALLLNQKELRNIKIQLAKMITLPLDEEFSVNGQLPESISPIAWEDILDQANEKNTNLLLAKSALAVRESEKKEALSRFYPQLGFYAAYNLNTAQNEVGFLLSNRVYGPSVGLTLRWDILDQLSRFQELKNAKIHIENAELGLKEQQLFISSELKKAFNEFEWASKTLSFELRNKVSTNNIVEIAKVSLDAGTITALELREIQFSLIEAQRRILSTQLDYVTAKLNLDLQTGKWSVL